MNTSLPNRRLFWWNWSDLVFNIDQENLLVRAEQLRTRMALFPSLLFSQAAIEPLFVWLLWREASHALLLLWLATILALHTMELLTWLRHRNELASLQQCQAWHFRFTFYAVVIGLVWGVAAFGFYPGDIGPQSLVICVMLGLVAGAVTINPVHPPSLYGYASGIMMPLIARVLFENDLLHWVLAFMLTAFAALIVSAGRGLNKTFVLSLQQRFENFSLLQQLTAQKSETEEARKQLEQANAVLLEHELKLEQMVHDRTAQLQQRSAEMVAIKDTTILALTSLAETRDNETGNHIRRTQNYVRILARHLQSHPRFSSFLTDENIEMLYKIAPLHDIGKVGIPDYILHKQGKLTPEEFDIMKTHTILGGNAISGAENMTNVRNSPFLKAARQIAIGHHERWDGSGYPFALSGDHIPLPARLMALADVYDAMTCRRVYKPAMPHEEVAAFIIAGRGRHFDPDVVDAFVAAQNEFKEIAQKYRDDGLSVDAWKKGSLDSFFAVNQDS